jgi:hypothetical protein
LQEISEETDNKNANEYKYVFSIGSRWVIMSINLHKKKLMHQNN